MSESIKKKTPKTADAKSESLSRVQFFATPWTTVHGILQARILEWVTFPFSRDQTQGSHIADFFLYHLNLEGSAENRKNLVKNISTDISI